ncbi:MAG: AEC family transporter [Thermoflavifilum sp.]|nr:AEC family transporter [Thermoflavifilum sp.]MCL6514843.1 AEC family transporter [Alicyclobacillus sp.]
MSGYLHLLWTTTVPILVVCVCGALLARFQSVDTKSLANVSLYILAPALVLATLPGAQIQGSHVLQIVEFTLIMTALCWGLGTLAGRLFRLDAATGRALTLTTIFSNCNNYGLPVLLLAFGAQGFALGTMYVVGQIILVNVLGVYIASSANGGGRSGAREVLRSPLLYACALAVILAAIHTPLPGGLGTTAKLLGDAYAAVVLLILGVQLGRTRWSQLRRADIWLGVGLRIVVVPLLTKLILWLLGIHGLLASVLFIESSMPAAVNAVALAEKYGLASDWVSMVVAVTTVLSFLYLPLLIAVG